MSEPLSPSEFRVRVFALWALAAVAIAVALLAPRIPQNPEYHAFADTRTVAGIPHFWNVVSNAPFLLAGAFGLWAFRRAQWSHPIDRWPWVVFVPSLSLVGIGSAYYHWTPNTQTLFWDRLPMTVGFMGIFAAVINERVHRPAGVLLLAPFLVLGALSVEVWRRGELTGVGDLRFYALVQFYPILAIPVMLWLFPARYTHSNALWWLVFWYCVAKLLEEGDRAVLTLTGGFMSGHALKHVAAAYAVFTVCRMLAQRQPSRSG